MREVVLKNSSNPKKKYDAYIDGKKVSFGATGYSDFTQHKDEERKQNYIARHRPNQNWNDLTTAGAWSKNCFGTNLPSEKASSQWRVSSILILN